MLGKSEKADCLLRHGGVEVAVRDPAACTMAVLTKGAWFFRITYMLRAGEIVRWLAPADAIGCSGWHYGVVVSGVGEGGFGHMHVRLVDWDHVTREALAREFEREEA